MMNSNSVASSSKIKFDEDFDSSSEEDEMELADIPFEELLKARSDGTVTVHQKAELKKSKRANKHMPMETSCKKPVSRFREVIQAPKRVSRDPRFESLCGNLDVDRFKKRYNFLFSEHLPTEKAELQKLLKSSKDPKAIEDAKKQLALVDKQLKSVSTRNTEAEILAEHKKKEREAAKQGKRPFYLKKSEIRKRKLIQKYESLKDAGKLDSFLTNKRRRNASKDHRFMPYRRPTNNEREA